MKAHDSPKDNDSSEATDLLSRLARLTELTEGLTEASADGKAAPEDFIGAVQRKIDQHRVHQKNDAAQGAEPTDRPLADVLEGLQDALDTIKGETARKRAAARPTSDTGRSHAPTDPPPSAQPEDPSTKPDAPSGSTSMFDLADENL